MMSETCPPGLTVFFDDPFWVGIYERVNDGKMEVAKASRLFLKIFRKVAQHIEMILNWW
jgi:hypothetical protein